MKRIFQLATSADLPAVMSLIDEARGIMRANGNPNQWVEGYPAATTIAADITNNHCVLCRDHDGTLVASFAFMPGPEPTYSHIYHGQWLNDDPYHVVHRLASTASSHGVMADVVAWCMQRSDNLRVDTHRDNTIMRHCLQQLGFTPCGIIYLANGDERLAFHKVTSHSKH